MTNAIPSTESSSQNIKPAICFVHGAFHGAWACDLLKPELEQLGHQVIVPDLEIEQALSHYDHAAAVAQTIVDHGSEEVMLVGHSRAGNWVIRVPDIVVEQIGKQLVSKVVYVGAAIQENTITHLIDAGAEQPPSKNSMLYDIGIKDVEGKPNMTEMDPEMAKFVFYKNCDAEIAQWAASKLRLQYRSENEPIIPARPNVPTVAIVLTSDSAITPARQLYDAKHSFKADEIIEFPSDHSPFLSYPKPFAKLLSTIAIING